MTKNNYKVLWIVLLVMAGSGFFGAALLAQDSGSVLPPVNDLMKANKIRFESYDDLKKVTDMVTYFESTQGTIKEGHEYILGIDGGSTTTKVCLIDIETDEIVASHYGRTHGDPIKSLKTCLVEVKKKIKEDIGNGEIKISKLSDSDDSQIMNSLLISEKNNLGNIPLG